MVRIAFILKNALHTTKAQRHQYAKISYEPLTRYSKSDQLEYSQI